jgi:peptide-methionine (S)-S-oxide reductase
MKKKNEIAVFGGGCFWCTEAIYKRVKGVISVTPGYAGGSKENPTYQQVCSGSTGHAEVIKVEFDPEVVSYRDLLEVFWHAHDPTTLNRQGNDIGTQYRSIILYADSEQKEQAQKSLDKAQKSGMFSKPIVTQVEELGDFYPAEDYHHDYFANNPNQPYCRAIISPKVRHFLQVQPEKLK